MKTLLIKPSTGSIYKNMRDIAPEYPPLGLAYIAAVLEKNNYEVKILDLAVNRFTKESLVKFIENYSPGIIGFNSTTPTTNQVYGIIKDLKNEFKEIMFVLGGVHASALPDEAMRYADIVVRGEGEITFLELVRAIEKKKFKHRDLKKIKGISFKYKNKNIHNPNRELIENLDELPFPARHLLNLNKYHFFGARKHPLTNIFTSRGCPYGCKYCNKNVFGRKFRARSVESVLDEIDLLVSKNVKELHVSDDTFNLDKKRANKICLEIKKRGYDLTIFPHNGIRVDSVDRELLKNMKDCGFYAMIYGVESGDQRILDNINKGIKIEQVLKAFKITKKFDFETWAFFIFGLPGETLETARKTINLAIKLDPDIAKFHILVPYPGTEVYEYYKNRLRVNKWEDFGIFSGPTFVPEDVTVEELQNVYKEAYRKFYLRPSPVFKSIKRILKHPGNFVENFKAGGSVLKMIR